MMYKPLIYIGSVGSADLSELVLDLILHDLVELLPLDPLLLIPRLLFQILKELINRILSLFVLLFNLLALLSYLGIPFESL